MLQMFAQDKRSISSIGNKRCLSTNPQRLARWIGGESQWEELEKEMGFRKEGEGESS